jgi:hypothetical protein
MAWRAERAFHFMRGTEAWGIAFAVEAEGRVWRVRRALELLPNTEDNSLWHSGNEVVLPFRDGRLRVLLAP